MCSPKVIEQIIARMPPAEAGSSRRADLASSAANSAAKRFSDVVDLTHPLPENFPTATGDRWLSLEDFLTYGSDRINFKIWHMHEHVGTHIDAPIHFSETGLSAEQIPVESLVVPLAVMDIRERAEKDPDTELTPEDIRNWEARHGELPDGCCVAVNSGWDAYVTGSRFRNTDTDGVMHFPGIHVDAAQMLARRPPCRRAGDRHHFDRPRSDIRLFDPLQVAASGSLGRGEPGQSFEIATVGIHGRGG